jgi:malonyl-CoA O-methyltransferase
VRRVLTQIGGQFFVTPENRRIEAAFSQAEHYDSAATVQAETARRLARRITGLLPASPARILEIGCGTGLLSQQLATAFPQAHLTFTDISAAMLARCRTRLGAGHTYRAMDGEAAESVAGPFDLIAASLTMQWFTNLPASIAQLIRLLSPQGKLVFATLGCQSFQEWRQAHTALGLPCGLHDYPSAQHFPLPTGVTALIAEEIIIEHHASGQAFARALKTLGANTPRSGYHPLPAGSFRQLLATLKGQFPVSYHILYVVIEAKSKSPQAPRSAH